MKEGLLLSGGSLFDALTKWGDGATKKRDRGTPVSLNDNKHYLCPFADTLNSNSDIRYAFMTDFISSYSF